MNKQLLAIYLHQCQPELIEGEEEKNYSPGNKYLLPLLGIILGVGIPLLFSKIAIEALLYTRGIK